ncbi:MAG: hypothetical protein JWM88_148 [Verrucomicrobia bacterium]|nr:hypothetical protein [Verrucomicrobiota bacterium]
MLLSVHIPKTAGASFRRILAQLYEEDIILKYWRMTDARGQVIAAIPPNIRCIHGHFHPEALLPDFPHAKLITWVRDPVQRVISSYYHRLRDPDWEHPVTRELHEKKLTVVQFAALDLMRNEMTRYFGGKRPKDFAFIGITERFEESVHRFLRVFGFPPVEIPRENCNPDRSAESYAVDLRTRDAIAALNESDLSIYHEVCQGI